VLVVRQEGPLGKEFIVFKLSKRFPNELTVRLVKLFHDAQFSFVIVLVNSRKFVLTLELELES
jgi:hypothetical protein